MLYIIIPSSQFYDESKEEFITIKEAKLQLEHSLVSLSKWESKWNKPFLNNEDKSQEENLDYIKCMTLTQNVNPMVYSCLSAEQIKQINEYIDAPMTATTFRDNGSKGPNRSIITSEIIYYWMISYNIPFECQKWHLNRLLTLIRVCDIKNAPSKKMSKKDILNNNKALNKARRAKRNSKG